RLRGAGRSWGAASHTARFPLRRWRALSREERPVRAVLLLLVLALALPAPAEPGWGLLLGLRLPGREGAPGEPPAPDRYRTLYVTKAGAVSRTPLLIPRKGRLWDVGVRRL